MVVVSSSTGPTERALSSSSSEQQPNAQPAALAVGSVSEERRVRVQGVDVAVVVGGEPSGPPVVALHGWLDNAGSWAPMAERLAGWRWHRVEMPGHGRSGHLAQDLAYHFVDYVDVVLTVLDELGLERVVLAGHSMGASVAMLFAGAFPERVERLVLVDGLGPLVAPAADGPAVLRRALDSRRAQRSRSHRLYPDRDAMADRMMKANPFLTPEATARLLERGAVEEAGGWRFAHDLRLHEGSALRFTWEHVDAFAAAVRCPTLVIRAHHGALQDEEQLARRMAQLPDARLVRMEGDHHLHLTRTADVAPVIEAFVAGAPEP